MILRKLRNCHFAFFGVVYLCYPWKADKRPFCLFAARLCVANCPIVCKYKQVQRKCLKSPGNRVYRRFFADHPPRYRGHPAASQALYPAFCRKFFLWKILLLSIFQLFMNFNCKVFLFFMILNFWFLFFIFLIFRQLCFRLILLLALCWLFLPVRVCMCWCSNARNMPFLPLLLSSVWF